jgi:hypothetical protein
MQWKEKEAARETIKPGTISYNGAHYSGLSP